MYETRLKYVLQTIDCTHHCRRNKEDQDERINSIGIFPIPPQIQIIISEDDTQRDLKKMEHSVL
jgi:hypothetical protein